jgi:hypothetical protein
MDDPAPVAGEPRVDGKDARRVHFDTSTQTKTPPREVVPPKPANGVNGDSTIVGRASLLDHGNGVGTESTRVGLAISMHDICASIPNSSRVATDKPGGCFKGDQAVDNSGRPSCVAPSVFSSRFFEGGG